MRFRSTMHRDFNCINIMIAAPVGACVLTCSLIVNPKRSVITVFSVFAKSDLGDAHYIHHNKRPSVIFCVKVVYTACNLSVLVCSILSLQFLPSIPQVTGDPSHQWHKQ